MTGVAVALLFEQAGRLGRHAELVASLRQTTTVCRGPKPTAALRGFGASIGVDVSPTAAIVPGAVMGIMLIPFISSFADDALTAVPRSMRDGAAALGATKSETIRQVLLPAALPGIVGGVLLAIGLLYGLLPVSA